jgi:hypothetical protein
VCRVRAIHTHDRDLLDLDYHDGRYARLRMERKGCYDFGATVHGERKLHQFKVDFAPVYSRLVQGMTRFFEGGRAPAELVDIVENVAVMQAGNESMMREGKWLAVKRTRLRLRPYSTASGCERKSFPAYLRWPLALPVTSDQQTISRFSLLSEIRIIEYDSPRPPWTIRPETVDQSLLRRRALH